MRLYDAKNENLFADICGQGGLPPFEKIGGNPNVCFTPVFRRKFRSSENKLATDQDTLVGLVSIIPSKKNSGGILILRNSAENSRLDHLCYESLC